MRLPSHILVIRFSSMGDVAMTVPVIINLLQQHPHLQVTIVSNAFFRPLFEDIERCHFFPVFLKDKHKGFAGMFRLFNEVKKGNTFDAVADLHGVLRSHLLAGFCRVGGYKIAVIDKGRQQKRELTRKHNKILRQLTAMPERYADVFRKLGASIDLGEGGGVFKKLAVPAGLASIFIADKKIIGIAPFAQYKEKMYPLEKMKSAVKRLALTNTILLFGGGENEAAVLREWEQEIFSVFNIAAKYSFKDELAIISNLNLMISMDSANMHLASLFNVPVLSIWGATHPYTGFYGWAQPEKNIVQADLYCRPCSVFGNKPCYRGDHACMNLIDEQVILQKAVDLE